MELYTLPLLMLVMFGSLYFFTIRPENKRKKEADKMRSELAVGDVATTIGGLVGTVCAVKERTVVLQTGADRVRVEFLKDAISGRTAPTADKAQ